MSDISQEDMDRCDELDRVTHAEWVLESAGIDTSELNTAELDRAYEEFINAKKEKK